MKLHRFNPDGIAAFSTYRARLTLEPTLPPPLEMLEDLALTECAVSHVEVPERKFANRLEAGKFFNDLLDAAGIHLAERDKGLWAWLTLFYFDEVCPADGHGRRNPQDEARLVPILDNHQRFYRHLLLGPFLIVRAHRDQPERAISMLCNPLWKPGEIVEQLASRKELVTNRAVVELATRLYYNPATGSFKRGAGSSVKGAPRRLAALFNQLDLTWYLYGMGADEVLNLLPKEFDRFRAAS
ncbi:MAG TPA: hypothetical protein VN578_24045 [Candidatus Binatia bacterium]|jgi:hypothetical protein|nr:hypothetical protein [Candidatus Binatia bacterium]